MSDQATSFATTTPLYTSHVIEGKGRCLVAQQTIPIGTTVMSEAPFESALAHQGFCMQCTRKISGITASKSSLLSDVSTESSHQQVDASTIVRASTAQRPRAFSCPHCDCNLFCSEQCFEQNHDHKQNQFECKVWRDLQWMSVKIDVEFGLVLLVFRIVKRALLDQDKSGIETVLSLETHRNDIRPQHLHSFDKCADRIRELLVKCAPHAESQILSHDDIVSIFCIIFVNAHGICPSESDHDIGIGLYPHVSLMSHDCGPSCCFSTDSQRVVSVRTIKEVSAGEELSISYVDLLQPTHIRRKALLETKYFLCQCARCRSPSELGSHFRAFKCKRCSGQEYVLPHYTITQQHIHQQMDALALQELDDDEFFDRYDEVYDRNGNKFVETLDAGTIWICEHCSHELNSEEARELHEAEDSVSMFIQRELVPDSEKWDAQSRLEKLESLLSHAAPIAQTGLQMTSHKRSHSMPLEKLSEYVNQIHKNHWLHLTLVRQIQMFLRELVAAHQQPQQPDDTRLVDLLRKSLDYRSMELDILEQVIPEFHFEIASCLRARAETKEKLALLLRDSGVEASSAVDHERADKISAIAHGENHIYSKTKTRAIT